VLKNHYQIFLVNLPSFAKLSFKKDKYKYRGITDAAQSQIPIDLHPARTRQYQVF